MTHWWHLAASGRRTALVITLPGRRGKASRQRPSAQPGQCPACGGCSGFCGRWIDSVLSGVDGDSACARGAVRSCGGAYSSGHRDWFFYRLQPPEARAIALRVGGGSGVAQWILASIVRIAVFGSGSLHFHRIAGHRFSLTSRGEV